MQAGTASPLSGEKLSDKAPPEAPPPHAARRSWLGFRSPAKEVATPRLREVDPRLAGRRARGQDAASLSFTPGPRMRPTGGPGGPGPATDPGSPRESAVQRPAQQDVGWQRAARAECTGRAGEGKIRFN